MTVPSESDLTQNEHMAITRLYGTLTMHVLEWIITATRALEGKTAMAGREERRGKGNEAKPRSHHGAKEQRAGPISEVRSRHWVVLT